MDGSSTGRSEQSFKAITHHLTIDQSRCPGKHLCHACEIIAPGLVDYCAQYGKVLIGPWALRDKSEVISKLAVACDARAIMVRPV